jgi:hypothetical protein
VHDELAALVRAGLTPSQALLTGTRHVAEYLGKLDSTGTVAVGKWADLVLLSGNPLQDIRHTREPVGVMIRGRWLDRTALDQGLLASPKYWLTSLLGNQNQGFEALPLSKEQREKFIKSLYGPAGLANRGLGQQRGAKHREKLMVLLDSLALTRPRGGAEHERVLRLFAAELGALRAIISPEQQHAQLDPAARVWLREQARQGYRVAVPGVPPTP